MLFFGRFSADVRGIIMNHHCVLGFHQHRFCLHAGQSHFRATLLPGGTVDDGTDLKGVDVSVSKVTIIGVGFYHFLPSSWQWKITLNERKLILKSNFPTSISFMGNFNSFMETKLKGPIFH